MTSLVAYPSRVAFIMTSAGISGVLAASFAILQKQQLLVVLVILLVATVCAGQFMQRRFLRFAVALGVVMLAVVLGALRMVERQDHARSVERFVHMRGERPVILRGYIASEPIIRNNVVEYIVKVDRERVLLTSYTSPHIAFGDNVQVEGLLKVPTSATAGGFDRRAYLRKEGIYVEMQNPLVMPVDFEQSALHRMKIVMLGGIYDIRRSFIRSLDASLSSPHAAFVAGILIGSRSDLPESVKEDFNRTGTSHIMAVSGYNITVVIGILSALFLTVVSRKHAFWLIVGFLIVFMILTGAQASVIRATIMGMSVLLARQVGRLPTPLHTLGLTAGIMVFLNPYLLRYDIGFQLSFLATLGILVVAPILEERMRFVRTAGAFGEAAVMTIAAQLCVLPLLIYYFQTVSLVSLPVNIIVLPLIPYAMLLGAATGVLGLLVPTLGVLAGYAARVVSGIILAVVHYFSGLSWAVITIDISVMQVLLAYLVLSIVIYYLHRNGKKQTIPR